MTNKAQPKGETKRKNFRIKPIGFVRANLQRRKDAPGKAAKARPMRWSEYFFFNVKALHRLQAGDGIIMISWLHRGQKHVMEVHPRGDCLKMIESASRIAWVRTPELSGTPRLTEDSTGLWPRMVWRQSQIPPAATDRLR